MDRDTGLDWLGLVPADAHLPSGQHLPLPTVYPVPLPRRETTLRMMRRRRWRLRAGRRAEPVTPLWHHWVIPVVYTNAYQRRTLSSLLKLRARPGAHILTLTPPWRMGGLSMAPGGPDYHHVTPRASVLRQPKGPCLPQNWPPLCRGVAAAADGDLRDSPILHRWMRLIALQLTWQPMLQSGNASRDAWPPPHELHQLDQSSTGRTSAFDRLGQHTPTPQEESKLVPHPEMTPHKIDHGRQPHKEQETQRAISRSVGVSPGLAMRLTPRKEGRKARGSQVKSKLVLIGWQRVSRNPFPSRIPIPQSSKLNVSGTSVRSTVAKESQKHGSGSRTRIDPSHTPNAQLGDLEKREIKDKPHRWIEARARCLDLAGYMEEINSLRYFGRNAGCFAL